MNDRNEIDTEIETRRRRTGPFRSAQRALSFLAALMLLGAGVAHAGPDLTPVDVDASAVTTDTQTLAISGNLQVSIQNIGDADVFAPFDVLAFEDLNDNGEFDGADQVLGTASYATGLPAGGLTDVSVAVAGTVQFAGNLIYASADSGNVIVEDDETNNLRNTGQGSQFIPTPGPFSPVLEWKWDASNAVVLPDALNIMNTPVVIDLTGDGIPEVIFGSTASRGGGSVEIGYLRALNGADGSEFFTVSDLDHRVNTAASVAAGDIDGDGLPEIIAARYTNNQLIAFEHDGTFKWISATISGTNWGAVTIADLDQDGTPEIIMGRQALDNNGNLLWTGSGNVGSFLGGMALVADVDLDGSPEVVAGRTIYSNTGAVEVSLTGFNEGPNAIGDFDDDDFAEIVTVSGGRVFLNNHDGSLIWGPVSIPGGGVGGPPTIADYDSDGEPEIGVAGASRYAVFETDGSLKWASVTQDGSSNRTGSSVFDFEGDGSAEVVYRDERFLRVYDGNDGTILFETPMSSCTWHEYISVADVDADGNAEIIAMANDNCGFGPQRGVFIYGDGNDNWVPTRKIWNQHTYHITNVNADGTIPQFEQNNWQVEGLNNYRLNEFLPGEGTSADAPDLVPSFIRFDQQNCPEFVTLTARVGNGGSLLAPTGLNVSFYDGPPGAGGTLIGTTQTSFNLESGQFEDVSVQWNAPPVGNADVYVVADDDGAGNGAINEGNEDNNTASASEVLCSPVCIDNLSARPKPGKIQLTWTHVQGATYDVLRSGAVGGPFTQIASTDSTYSTYLDQPVDNGVPYYYQIRRMPGVLGEASCLSDVLGAVAPEGRRDRLTTVPDIREQSQAAAEAALAAANLGVGAVTLVASDTVPAGDVVDQDPPPNSVVPQGFAVAFSVSTGVGGPTNTLPIADAGGDETITEGDALNRAGSFVDPDANTWTATVDYGDGGGPQGLFLTPAKTFDLGHVYVDDGVFTVTVTVNDGTGSGATSFTVQVLNAAPLVEAGSDRTITAGDSTSLDPASFTDAGIADSHTATIDWGDGTVEPGVVTQGAGSGVVAGSHAYADPATYVVTVTVTDNAAGSGSDTFTVLVNAVQVTVPDVVGLSQAAAEAAIIAADLTVGTVSTANSDTVPAGDVISQNPGGGSLAAEGSAVDLVVSLGPAQVTVPDVVGLAQAAAEAAIIAADLTVGTVSTANSDTVPAGDVISQNPGGGSLAAEGSAVDLVVSLGPAQVTVPDVVGLSQAAAEAAIIAADLTVGTVSTANSDTVPAGDVISQNPGGGSLAAEGSAVDLVVSLGPAQVTVPDVVGLSQAAAEAAIIAADLTVGTVSTANSDTVPAGDVISQNPGGGSLAAEGSAVDLVVSLGPAQVTVPDVVGLSQAAAEAAIIAADLTVGTVSTANSDTVPAGDVISQNPGGGSLAAEGSAVDLVVSLGPAQVTVPDVVGLAQAAAEAAIIAADLTVGTVSTANSDTVPAGDVISQNPGGGSSAAEGSAVDLVVSLGPAQVTVPDVVGLTEAGATANILAANLTVGTISTQSSDTVPDGDVISQDPAAGSSVAQGAAVDFVVSTGPAAAGETLTLSLSTSAITAGDSITVTPSLTDNTGDPVIPVPLINYAISFTPGEASGTSPTEAGAVVSTSADTRGVYTVTGIVDGATTSASEEFVVYRPAAESGQKALQSGLGTSVNGISSAAAAIEQALADGNIPGVQAALNDMRAARDAVDRFALRRTTAFAPEGGFLPSTAELTAEGFPQTADDATLQIVINNIAATIENTSAVYRTLNAAGGIDDDVTLANLNADLQALLDQLNGLNPTVHGWVEAKGLVNYLYAVAIPEHLHAVVDRYEQAILDESIGVGRNQSPLDMYRNLDEVTTPDEFYADNRDAFFSLSGMSVAVNIQMKIISNVYGPILHDLARSAALLIANDLLNQFVNNLGLPGIKTGASLSIHVFNQPNSWIEVVGANREIPARSDVWLVGTAAIAAVENLFTALDPSDIEDLDDVWEFFEGVVDAIEGAGEAAETANQEASSIFPSCIFSSSSQCVELVYPSGFESVNECSGFFCFAQPVLVLVHNLDTGTWAFDLFNFNPP